MNKRYLCIDEIDQKYALVNGKINVRNWVDRLEKEYAGVISQPGSYNVVVFHEIIEYNLIKDGYTRKKYIF